MVGLSVDPVCCWSGLRVGTEFWKNFHWEPLRTLNGAFSSLFTTSSVVAMLPLSPTDRFNQFVFVLFVKSYLIRLQKPFPVITSECRQGNVQLLFFCVLFPLEILLHYFNCSVLQSPTFSRLSWGINIIPAATVDPLQTPWLEKVSHPTAAAASLLIWFQSLPLENSETWLVPYGVGPTLSDWIPPVM